nr:phosphinothricin acetyltransferase [uncultured Capnocytophaga sp.]
MWRVIYSVSPRTPEGGQAGKRDKPPPLHILCSRGTHTQLLLAIFKRGIVATKGELSDVWERLAGEGQ